MANQDAALNLDDDDPLDEDITAGVRRKKLSGKKLVLFVGSGLLALALIVGGAQYFGVFSSDGGSSAQAGGGGHGGGGHGSSESSSPGQTGPEGVVFYEMPEMLVSLNTGSGDSNYLKLRVTLELANGKGAERLEKVMPRIVDKFQVYLRELRLEDLEGSAGLTRLKEELLVRVNAAADPVRVKDVLFKEMLVQ